ncbi:MAG TPA: hypothetical protein VFH95_02265 [Candidatus Kapabacteria bacterium]|nr:hypothetical protein [Candidatus Kapabacteria bacterium]
MKQVDNRKRIVDSASGSDDLAVNNGSSDTGRAGSSIVGDTSDLRVWHAAAIFVLFMLAMYWPVFLGKRFFWEDFFILDFPARDYAFYMVALKHTLPFWNPYNWAWSAWLADPQTAFWYPTNLLQIAVAKLFQPGASHPSVLWPEVMTLLHIPLACLGMFVLLRKEFKVSPAAALLAALTFGFGLRMIAEQNHPAKIIQLSLLPWETLLLMRSWRIPRYAAALGILLGVSFLAGQPQVFFFIAFFLGCFTLAESLIRWKEKRGWRMATIPVGGYAVAIILAAGIAAIQLLPSLELANASARVRLGFSEASYGAIQLGHLINFFVPKFYGENPGYTTPVSAIVHEHTWYWYWEAEYYWGMLPEILAMFAVVVLWKKRSSDDPRTRYLFFAVAFSIFALAFGLGSNLYFQWIFWKFVPLFDRFRAPNRMIWLLWFFGSIYGAIGLELLLTGRNSVRTYSKFLFWACGIFVGLNVLAISGSFDLVFPPFQIREGLWKLILPSLILSTAITIFFLLLRRGKLPVRATWFIAAALIVVDLFYFDFTWYRNGLDRTTLDAQNSGIPAIHALAILSDPWQHKLLWLHRDSDFAKTVNLGTILRLPIEDVQDSTTWTEFNPVRPLDPLPLIQDSTKRMEIMGVTMRIEGSGKLDSLLHALPFLKVYHRWSVASNDSEARRIYNDSTFDFHTSVILDCEPAVAEGAISLKDTAVVSEFSENHLRILAQVSGPSVLLVNGLYYPAWKATVDGKETNILRAFTNLRGIPLGAGIHTVELRYDSSAFNLGWKITLGTLALSLLVLFIGKSRKTSLDSEVLPS